MDGIGINGSRDVRISDCDVDTGDDAIIIKCSHDDLTCERVTVTNCVLSTNCAAVGIGAEVRGRINDVVFSNCFDSDRYEKAQPRHFGIVHDCSESAQCH